MSGTDAYLDWDAAYVLGALDAAERVEYEQHLAGCPRCQAAVAELAGVPGLLAQLSPGEALALDVTDGADLPEPPRSLMPVLPAASVVRLGERRRPRRLLLAVAAAAVVGALGGYAVSATTGDRAPAPVATVTRTGGDGGSGSAARLAFSPVEPSLMTAVVDVVPVAAGTELRVECQYARAPGSAGAGTSGGSGTTGPGTSGRRDGASDGTYSGDDGVDYAIWVVDRTGKATELHAWTARPDVVMHPVGRTGLSVGRIDAVEIRRVADGHTVMRASVA